MENARMSLHQAIKKGDLSQVKALLESGTVQNINQKSSESADKVVGWTALHYAVHTGNLDIVRCLLDAGVDINAQEDKDDRTALIMAVSRKDLACIKLLISYKANINLQQLDGDTPLIRAASEGFAEIVKMLIEAGADVHLTDNLGWSALIWASTNGFGEVVQLLINKKIAMHEKEMVEDRTALLIAASVGNTEIARLLLHEKNDGTATTFQRAMMAAATNGHFEIVNLLRKNEK
jgi:ankyrin repeat protein